MQPWVEFRYRKKQERPAFISPVLLFPKAAIRPRTIEVTKAGLLTYSAIFAAFPYGPFPG